MNTGHRHGIELLSVVLPPEQRRLIVPRRRHLVVLQPEQAERARLAYQFGLEWGAARSRSFRFVVIDEAFGRGSDESAQYGLRLFQQLNLQLLIVTPLQKIHIIEPFVASVGFVHNEGGRDSRLRCLSIEEYRAHKSEGTATGMADGTADAGAAVDDATP